MTSRVDGALIRVGLVLCFHLRSPAISNFQIVRNEHVRRDAEGKESVQPLVDLALAQRIILGIGLQATNKKVCVQVPFFDLQQLLMEERIPGIGQSELLKRCDVHPPDSGDGAGCIPIWQGLQHLDTLSIPNRKLLVKHLSQLPSVPRAIENALERHRPTFAKANGGDLCLQKLIQPSMGQGDLAVTVQRGEEGNRLTMQLRSSPA
mmetsp:Transcript_30590/g.77267  ORF Transcript_30590/g.77267 Transcript_30590/m.77267 type:complete len:206 (+) Transcript_30590:753-1370(+)